MILFRNLENPPFDSNMLWQDVGVDFNIMLHIFKPQAPNIVIIIKIHNVIRKCGLSWSQVIHSLEP